MSRYGRSIHKGDPVADSADDAVQRLWSQILADPNLRYYVAVEKEKIVAACTLTLIPNLTRGLRPYGLIENVVTAPDFGRRGFATEVLRFALDEAWCTLRRGVAEVR